MPYILPSFDFILKLDQSYRDTALSLYFQKKQNKETDLLFFYSFYTHICKSLYGSFTQHLCIKASSQYLQSVVINLLMTALSVTLYTIFYSFRGDDDALAHKRAAVVFANAGIVRS